MKVVSSIALRIIFHHPFSNSLLSNSKTSLPKTYKIHNMTFQPFRLSRLTMLTLLSILLLITPHCSETEHYCPETPLQVEVLYYPLSGKVWNNYTQEEKPISEAVIQPMMDDKSILVKSDILKFVQDGRGIWVDDCEREDYSLLFYNDHLIRINLSSTCAQTLESNQAVLFGVQIFQ